MTSDPRIIAARLGIDEATVRQLQARGHLLRLDATEAEIRERLVVAHVRAQHPRDMPIVTSNNRDERPVPRVSAPADAPHMVSETGHGCSGRVCHTSVTEA